MSGIGIDLLDIARLERALARRPGLAERLFTDGERAYAARRARPGLHLAARFCAKEAVAKALSLDVLRWREIEVVGEGGAPAIRLHGATAAAAPGQVHVSLTHTDHTAGAVAVVAAG
jgi:holo-[acyl-carrier protein] synthase